MVSDTDASVSFSEVFDCVDDPRIPGRTAHLLESILFIAVTGTIAGADGPEDMAKFAEKKRGWLERFVNLENGVPSHDTIGRVLGIIKPEQFRTAFLDWVSSIGALRGDDGEPLFMPIDGKTMRGSFNKADRSDLVHIVSAWASQQGITLGQVAVETKSNEIIAIPQLLEMLELAGAIVSIDALGCQRKIAAKIIEGGGDYVLQVKSNQETLLEAIENTFSELDDDVPQKKVRRHTTREKSRGRLETRRYTIMPSPASMANHVSKWTNLTSIGRVVREVDRGTKVTSETSYYISSLDPKVRLFSKSVRNHWGIENGLHWVLDVVFGEDKSRIRNRNAAINVSFLRRFVITLLKRDTSKSSLKQKRKEAAWDTQFLEKLLFG